MGSQASDVPEAQQGFQTVQSKKNSRKEKKAFNKKKKDSSAEPLPPAQQQNQNYSVRFSLDSSAVGNDDLARELQGLWHGINSWIDQIQGHVSVSMSTETQQAQLAGIRAKMINRMNLYPANASIKSRKLERLSSYCLKAEIAEMIVETILANPWSGLHEPTRNMLHAFYTKQEKDNPHLARMWKADLYTKALDYPPCLLGKPEKTEMIRTILEYFEARSEYKLTDSQHTKLQSILDKAVNIAIRINASAAQYHFMTKVLTKSTIPLPPDASLSDQGSETLDQTRMFVLTPGFFVNSDFEGNDCPPVLIVPQKVYYADDSADLELDRTSGLDRFLSPPSFDRARNDALISRTSAAKLPTDFAATASEGDEHPNPNHTRSTLSPQANSFQPSVADARAHGDTQVTKSVPPKSLKDFPVEKPPTPEYWDQLDSASTQQSNTSNTIVAQTWAGNRGGPQSRKLAAGSIGVTHQRNDQGKGLNRNQECSPHSIQQSKIPQGAPEAWREYGIKNGIVSAQRTSECLAIPRTETANRH